MNTLRTLIRTIFVRTSRTVEEMNPDRRRTLRYIGLGGGGFLLGKIVGPSLTWFNVTHPFSKEHFFDNFRVVESGDELGFYDRVGNEILVIEKDK